MSTPLEKQYRLKKAAEILGVSTATLRAYIDTGKISGVRTLGGHRRVPEGELRRILNQPNQPPTKAVIYARVSSRKQQQAGNLDRQVERLQAFAHDQRIDVMAVVTDVASGLNENRKGLNRVLRLAREGTISQIVIEFRDRLSRFGYQYLAAYFALAGVTLRVTEDTTDQPTEESDLNKELMEDLVAIIYSFSGKLYGRRSARFRKLRRCVKATLPPEA